MSREIKRCGRILYVEVNKEVKRGKQGEGKMKREFTVLRDGLSVYVEEYRPKGDKETYPAIIFSHGFGGTHEGMEFYCEKFAKAGYAAYCFDFFGGSVGDTGKSDGSSLDMTILTECEDLEAVLDEIKSYPYIDTDNIILSGESQGGFVSALVAARRKDEIKSIMLIYPAFCIPDAARLCRLGGAVYAPDNIPDVIACFNGMNISPAYHYSVVDMDPYKEISAFKGPVLILQGKCDSVVHYSYAIKAKASYESGQCELCLLEETDHYFPDETRENAFLRMCDFLEGKKEWLTITVFVTGCETVEQTEGKQSQEVYFTGYCDNEHFRGCIVPEGVDTQSSENGEWKLHAKYQLEGLDANGNRTGIAVVNEKVGDRYRPRITTDSALLTCLNEKDLVAILEHFKGGLTVRILG